jgi:hypothetical protein
VAGHGHDDEGAVVDLHPLALPQSQ